MPMLVYPMASFPFTNQHSDPNRSSPPHTEGEAPIRPQVFITKPKLIVPLSYYPGATFPLSPPANSDYLTPPHTLPSSVSSSSSGYNPQPASPVSLNPTFPFSNLSDSSTFMRKSPSGIDSRRFPYSGKTVPIKLPDASIKEIPADRVTIISWLSYMQREYHILDQELTEANRRANLPPPPNHANPIGYYMSNEKTLTQLKVQFTRICNNIELLQEVLATLPVLDG